CHIALLRRMGPRLRGDDNGESLLHISWNIPVLLMIMSNLPTPEPWSLHPQLARDTIAIGDLALSRLLVVNDANWPWLLLVPRRAGASEIIDLDEVERAQLM